jgi:23S rRNA pseudoU1915 N3-methylase RlmH
MKIDILCISDSDKHFAGAVAEYMKRLSKSVEIYDLKPYRHDNPAFIITKETQQIKEILQKKFAQHYKILLSKSGKDLKTEDL